MFICAHIICTRIHLIYIRGSYTHENRDFRVDEKNVREETFWSVCVEALMGRP